MKLAIGIVCAIASIAAFGIARGWRPKAPTADGVSTVVELAGFGAITAAAFLFKLELGLVVGGILLVVVGAFVIVNPEEARRPARAGADR